MSPGGEDDEVKLDQPRLVKKMLLNFRLGIEMDAT